MKTSIDGALPAGDNPAHTLDTDLHGPYWPVPVRAGEQVHVDILGDAPRASRPWRMSPQGLELLEKNAADKGTKLTLAVRLAESRFVVTGTVLDCVAQADSGLHLVRVRLDDTRDTQGTVIDARQARRWSCNPLFAPTGYWANPIAYNDRVFFRIANISSSGLLLLTSLRNKYIAVGQALQLNVTLPIVGEVNVDVEVIRCRISATDSLQEVGVAFRGIRRSQKEKFAQFVLQFANGEGSSAPTIQDLRKDNFPVNNALPSFDFGFVQTDAEYQEVLRLRYLAFKEGTSFKGPEDTADVYDERARILVAKHRGRIVGSVRLVFHEATDTLQHEKYFKLPPSFVDRRMLVEASRACTDPEFRGAELLMGLLRHAALTALRAGRRYIVQSADPSMMRVYRPMGFRDTGIHFKHPLANNRPHIFAILDVFSVQTGGGVSPMMWAYGFSDLWKNNHIPADTLKDFTAVERVRLSAYRAATPLCLALINIAKKVST